MSVCGIIFGMFCVFVAPLLALGAACAMDMNSSREYEGNRLVLRHKRGTRLQRLSPTLRPEHGHKVRSPSMYRGRKPSFTRAQFNTVRDMLGQGAVGIAQTAKAANVSRQTIYRIKDDPASTEAALAAWGL